MTIRSPVRPNTSLFSQKGVNYMAKSYLYLSNDYATTDRSITLDKRNYHLVSLHEGSSSYLVTAIKIASYLTIILPILAAITMSITNTEDYCYESKDYINSFRDMLVHHPKEAKALTLLDPTLIYKKRPSGQSTLVEIFQNGSLQECKAISELIKDDPRTALTKDDKKALLRMALTGFSVYKNFNSERLAIIEALNIATKGDLHQHLTKDDITKMFKGNYKLWAYLTSKTNPFRIDPRIVEVDLDCFYDKLLSPSSNNNTLTQMYHADPTVLTRQDPMGKTLFMNILTNKGHTLKESIDWIIKTNLNSILTKENKETLIQQASCNPANKRLNDVIKSLNQATRGGIHKDLTKDDLNNMLKHNYNLWAYLTSKTNPFPINPKIVEVDLNYFYDKLLFPRFNDESLTEMYNADPTVLTRNDATGTALFMKILRANLDSTADSLNWIIKTNASAILTKENKETLIQQASCNPANKRLNDVIKSLNQATRGGIHKDLTKDDLNNMLKHNYDLWAYLTSKTNPFPINPKIVEVDLDHFYKQLLNANSSQDPLCLGHYNSVVTAMYNTDPNVLTREDNEETIFIKILKKPDSHSAKCIEWIIKNDIKSIFTPKNKKALFEQSSNKYNLHQKALNVVVITLHTGTQGEIHKDLTKDNVSDLHTNNRPLWDYLTNASKNNSYPIDPKLYTSH